jgi:cation diffusion facilitator family transporter
MKRQKKSNHTKEGVRISIISILFSLVLTLFKLVSGIVGKSAALVSDGVNSLGDIFSYSVVATGVAASDKKADSNHQYGHDKLESIISHFLALIIAVTGFAIGFKAVRSLVVETYIAIPTLFPLIVAALSIVIKLILWQLARVAAVKTDLSSLKALASDHFSDMLSSTGALIAVIGARLGYPLLDPVASLVIALLIIKSAFEVFLISYNVLMATALFFYANSVFSQPFCCKSSFIGSLKKSFVINYLFFTTVGHSNTYGNLFIFYIRVQH